MLMSVYLHSTVAAVLRCFGTLDEVTDRILQLAADGHFDVTHMPPCGPRDGAARYNIEVTEPNYLQLLEDFGPHNSSVSLRRVLYWFVENQVYEEYGWEQSVAYKDKVEARLKRYLATARDTLTRASHLPSNKQAELQDIIQRIDSIQEDIRHV